jgi:hypothetical protein
VKLNSRAVGEYLERFAEFQPFRSHEKAKHITTNVADPTFERLPFRIHLKAGPCIVVPRAEADKIASLPAQRHIASHKVDDVDSLANLFFSVLEIVKRHGNL